MIENREWKWAYVSVMSAVIFSLICFGALNYMDGMAGGYAVAFFAFFLMVVSIAVTGLFFHRARIMDSIITSREVLAHWIYPEEIARMSAMREFRNFRNQNHALFILIGGMLGVVAIFFILFFGEEGLETGMFAIGIAILLFIVSRITPEIELKRALSAPHEAFIAHNGIIYEGAVYPFHSFMMTITGISLKPARGKDPSLLLFSFNQLIGAYIIQSYTIAIPVPVGEEDAADRIIHTLLDMG